MLPIYIEPNYLENENNTGDPVQKCHYSEIPEDPENNEPEKKMIRIRTSLFFDGTANNRINTTSRIEKSDAYNSWRLPWTSKSYENDFTNISKLEQIVVKDERVDISFTIYIEGIGTTDNKGDSYVGMTTGTWGTGIEAKVQKGIENIIIEIDAQNTDKLIDYIQIDTFGFSRGAAAARHFIHAAIQDSKTGIQKKLTDKGYEVNSVYVEFVGLFDTVSSHGLNFEDDTSKLNLDAIKYAKKVLQIAAADEYRKNFALTNIKSAQTKGTEIFLPGAHSDIGGGYIDKASEIITIYQLMSSCYSNDHNRVNKILNKEKKWLIENGWCNNESEIDVDRSICHKTIIYGLQVNRSSISNEYNRIPLHIMASYAKNSNIKMNETILHLINYIPFNLINIKKEIDKSIEENNSHLSYWQNNKSKTIKELRHKYLHLSANYGGVGANIPLFTDDDEINAVRTRYNYAG